MYVLAIDPGSEYSGVAYYNVTEHTVIWADDTRNGLLSAMICSWDDGLYSGHDSIMAIEQLENQGQFVGRTTFDTGEWIGRFRQAWEMGGRESYRISRRDVKTVMCGGNTFTDPNTGAQKTVNDTIVSRAVRNRFPATGGGKRPEVGTKAQPGPLYGIKGSHQYSAIAIALTWVDIHNRKAGG